MEAADHSGSLHPSRGRRLRDLGRRLRLALAQVPAGPLALLRFLAIVAAAVIDSSMLEDPSSLLIFVGVAIYVATSTPWYRAASIRITDLALAALLVVSLGGLASPYLPFVVLAVMFAGLTGAAIGGLAAGLAVTVAQLGVLVETGRLEATDPIVLVSELVLLPLAGVTGGLLSRILEAPPPGRRVLEQANRLLADLQRLARNMPGGLDVATVCAATLDEAKNVGDPVFGTVFMENQGSLVPTASFGLQEIPLDPIGSQDLERLLPASGARIVVNAALPDSLSDLARPDVPYWALTPLSLRGEVVGLLLLGYPNVDRVGRLRRRLEVLAHDVALALDNARLLEQTQTRALDSARRQIAHDLHDGVAQSLTHLRMELELLALESESPRVHSEARRLSSVAERALADVRSMIAGLRASAAGGLANALARHVEELNARRSTLITFNVEGQPSLSPHVSAEVFAAAREVIAQSLGRRRTTRVNVSLEEDAETDVVTLSIADNGETGEGEILELDQLRARVRRVGGTLTVRDRQAGGTIVTLTLPMHDQQMSTTQG